MAKFKREERYIVIKRSRITGKDEYRLRRWMEYHGIGTIDCVVVEHDWPIYEDVWDMVQRLAEDRPQKADQMEALLQDAQHNASVAEEKVETLMDNQANSMDIIAQLQRDNDALAAHVESANSIFQRGAAFEIACDAGTAWAVDPAEVAEWQRESPTTRLARLKARWQADALEECFNDCRQLEASPPKIMKAHIDRRRQDAGGE